MTATVMAEFAKAASSDLFPEDVSSRFTPQLKLAAASLCADVYDTAAWMVIMRHYNSVPGINDEARSVFEAFLNVFPTAADYVRSWTEMHINDDAGLWADSMDAVEILSR